MDTEESAAGATGGDRGIVRFWETARSSAGLGRLPAGSGMSAATIVPPPAWAFGRSPEQADELLALVLDGTKTATASAHWAYEVEGQEMPRRGELSIVLGGDGHPRALVRTAAVDVVPFSEVGEEHARAEGEGDRSLAQWRRGHERFFTAELVEAGREFSDDMLVVCEVLELLHPRRSPVTDRGPALVDA